jgi:hypothetical protein
MADTPDLGFEKQPFFDISSDCINHHLSTVKIGLKSLLGCHYWSFEKTMKVAQKVAQSGTGKIR